LSIPKDIPSRVDVNTQKKKYFSSRVFSPAELVGQPDK